MPDYLAFVYGGIAKPGESALTDGVELANQCLSQLGEIEGINKDVSRRRFPPRLLILLPSPAYLQQGRAEQLLKGVYETFTAQEEGKPADEKIQLIGSSVAGVFFDRQVRPEGALLICLASRLIKAQVAFGANARHDSSGAVERLLEKLHLGSSAEVDPNPLANRRILTFMPGCRQPSKAEDFYPAPGILSSLYSGVQARIRLVGGVSSANDPSRKMDGLQFAQGRVLQDAVVAASINSDVPIGVALNDGLISTKRVLQVTGVGSDKRTILEFDGRKASEQLGSTDVMLAKLSADDERIVDIPLEVADGAVHMLRPVQVGDYFQVMRAGPPINKIMKEGIDKAKHRVYAKRPAAALIFGCKAHHRANAGITNIEGALKEMEQLVGGPCLGGFFDGELGVDETGRSRLTNGGISYVVFGDEMRERTPLYQGVSALAKFGGELLAGFDLPNSTNEETIVQAIGSALDIVKEAGFPGAMISLIQSHFDRIANQEKRFIIAQKAFGPRFSRIVDVTKRSWESDDILAIVARDGKARFVPDSKRDLSCDQQAIELADLLSQYVLPLKRLDGTVFGTLQVDLGDLRNSLPANFCKSEQARMLDCFGVVIGAGIHRIGNALKGRILAELDQALTDSMSASSIHEGLEQFVKAAGAAFGAEMAHLRVLEPSEAADSLSGPRLVLETGYGPCFEAEEKNRREIPVDSRSPIGYAFNSEQPQVVNDLAADPAWKEMLNELPPDSKLLVPLNQTKSYAAVSFRNDRNVKLGAISFGSTKPWFFLRFHQKSLKVLAGRLAFLIEHLRATVQRDKFFRQREFLYKVSPSLAQQNLRDIGTTLQNVTKSFHKELNADVASLYLWDQDRERYVLRAEEGWKKKGWVHAASYDKKAGWIGITAIDMNPLYVPDLFAHYNEHGYKHPEGLYARYMFNEPLSESFRVEALGLPLRIGPDKKDKFGVLTLYRRVGHRRSRGFTTTDPELLEKGAYNAAGLVNAVLKQHNDDWARQQDKHRNDVVRALNSGNETEHFEADVCREVLKYYDATQVSFYRIDIREKEIAHSWIAGYRRRPRCQEPEKMTAAFGDPSSIIQETVRSKLGKAPYGVVLKRLKGKGHSDPRALKIRKLVEKACVPLLADRNYRGALLIRWKPNPEAGFSHEVRQDARHLQKLGQALGAIDLRRQMKKEAAQSQLAVQTAGIYVFQQAHRLGNATQSLYRITEAISATLDEGERQSKIAELEMMAKNNTKLIGWVIDLGQQVQNPLLDPVSLHYLIQKSWLEIALVDQKIPRFKAPEIQVSKDMMVRADARLAREVFVNLMNNALNALRADLGHKLAPPRLSISATISEDKDSVEITFEDNGPGMSAEKIAAAERGFVAREQSAPFGHPKGVGVLISLYLLRVQKGALRYDSEVGKFTKAIVTLPISRSGRRNNGMATV